MKTISSIHTSGILFVVLTLLVASCAPLLAQPTQGELPGNQVVSSKRNRITNPKIPGADQAALAAGNRAFAVDLYQQLRQQDGNLFFSPYSISLALAMTYAGARADTAQQMAQTLHFTLPAEQLHPAFNALDQALESIPAGSTATPAPGTSSGQDFQLSVANAIWGQQGYSFMPDYLDLLAQNYGAGLRLADFTRAPEPSRQAINDWVSQQTNEKIQNLFPKGTIDSSTRLALVNAIYFKASWLFPFQESDTREGVFTLEDGSPVTVPMMHSGLTANQYLQGDGFQAVSLPYFGEKASLVIVLPDEGKISAFEAGLDAARLEAITSGLEWGHVNLSLPKFKLESSFALANTLARMGMPAAFDGSQADFSGMDGQRDLFISAVVHKAFIAIDEKGTEAAAATGVAMAAGAMLNPPAVVVNRPFFFFIYAPNSGTILFAGRVMDPR